MARPLNALRGIGGVYFASRETRKLELPARMEGWPFPLAIWAAPPGRLAAAAIAHRRRAPRYVGERTSRRRGGLEPDRFVKPRASRAKARFRKGILPFPKFKHTFKKTQKILASGPHLS
jgi:hypothetical protein